MIPLFLTRENKYPVGWAMYAFAAGLYLISNHFHLFEPQMLPMTWIDRALPFMPNTIWIYLSEILLFATTYILSRDHVNLNKYVCSFIALQIVSVGIFAAWPTTFPRAQFPLPEDVNSLTYYAFHALRQADSPANCSPSLHVSGVYLSSFIFLDEQPRKFPFFFVWATAIALSTMTTKQHYFIDITTGFVMAVIVFWTFHRYASYKTAPQRA